MGTKRAKAPKKSRRKQQELPEMNGPGVEPVQFDDIDEIASEYVKKRDERIVLLGQEVDAKRRLKSAMDKHTLKTYEYDGYIVCIVPGEEVLKVKKAKKTAVEIQDDGGDD